MIKIDDRRWIQPEHVTRVTRNGLDGQCVIHFVDDHSITVACSADAAVLAINNRLAGVDL